MMRNRVWLAIAAASFGWGLGGPGTRAAFEQDVPPLALVALRTVIAAVLVIAYLAFQGRLRRIPAHTTRLGLVVSVANYLGPLVLLTYALEYASAGFVGLLIALIPITTAVWSHFLVPTEPLFVAKLGTMLIAVVGVAILLLSGDSGLGAEGEPLLAAALALAGVVLASFGGAFAKRHAGTYDPFDLSLVQFATSAVALVAMAAVVEGRPDAWSTAGWLWVGFLGAVSTFLPFVLFFWLLGVTSATQASLSGYLVPLVSVVAGVLLLDEKLEAGIVVGGVLILVGVVMTDAAMARRSPVALPSVEPG